LQSNSPVSVIALTLTLTTGLTAFLANYFLLDKIWTLPPTFWGSVTMTAFYGAMSFAVKYIVLRLFNAREK
jgi:hypothetical protein